MILPRRYLVYSPQGLDFAFGPAYARSGVGHTLISDPAVGFF